MVKWLFEDNSVEHSAEALNDVRGHERVDFFFQMTLGILLADVLYRQLFRRHFFLILQRLKQLINKLIYVTIQI